MAVNFRAFRDSVRMNHEPDIRDQTRNPPKALSGDIVSRRLRGRAPTCS